MKDYFDLWILAKHSDFEGSILSTAIRATFEQRRTATPSGVPIGLTDEFTLDAQKEKHWLAFRRKNALDKTPLAAVVDDLRSSLLPVLSAGAAGGAHDPPSAALTRGQTPCACRASPRSILWSARLAALTTARGAPVPDGRRREPDGPVPAPACQTSEISTSFPR